MDLNEIPRRIVRDDEKTPTLESVTIVGDAKVGEEITISELDPDTSEVNFQWQKQPELNSTPWTDIEGATENTYVIQESDIGYNIRVLVSAEDDAENFISSNVIGPVETPDADLVYVYEEDFEESDGGYTVSGTNTTWQWGTPITWPGGTASGTKSWGTNLSGDYSSNANESLTSPVINIASYGPDTSLRIQWMQSVHIESYVWDKAHAEVSVNGGPWTTMWVHAAGTTQSLWTEMSYMVNNYNGGGIQLRWRLTSDSIIEHGGYYIDDVKISLISDI